MRLVTLNPDGSVVIGGKPFITVYAAQHQWDLARRATRNPFKKMLAAAVLIELKAIER
jgi:hypothetical protein